MPKIKVNSQMSPSLMKDVVSLTVSFYLLKDELAKAVPAIEIA